MNVKQFLVKILMLESMIDLLDNYVIYSLMMLQRFAAFLAPLTSGRINIAVSSVYMSKVLLLIQISLGHFPYFGKCLLLMTCTGC